MNKYRTKELRNKRMNDDTYALRRKVIEIVYEIKKIHPTLPRVNVRITENGRGEEAGTLGLASVGDCIVWIPERAIKDGFDLRQIVYHEVLHAVFSLRHNEDCPLMCSTYKGRMDRTEIERRFLQIISNL